MIDFIIIGSGVSGGRIALELTRSGARCLLLEAGKRFSSRQFPLEEIDYSSQLFWGGGLELSHDGKMGFLRGKCVGGTSIVNQALLDEFDEDAWQDWRNRTGISHLSSSEMLEHYRSAGSDLKISEIPAQHFNRNTQVFTRGFEKLGYRWGALHRGQDDCALDQGTDCIACLGGCPRESKQSTLVTTLRKAESLGLQVEAECEVHRIEKVASGGFRVFGLKAKSKTEWRASKIVMAAGSLGNTKILLQSGYREKLPALGTSFTCHPQFMTYGFFQEPIDAHKGAFQAVKSADPKLRAQGVKLENVFAPPIATAMLFKGYGQSHFRWMKRYRHLASIEVAIRDEAVGRIELSRGGKLVVKKPLTDVDRRKSKWGIDLVTEILSQAGAREIETCYQVFGLHLMGGCPLGSDPKNSVFGSDYQLHDEPGIYSADSSVFPSAPGINPSFTVMALSQHASREMVRR